VRRADFHYELPEHLIAQQPLAERSASRLLTLDGATGALADRQIRDFPALLNPGDLLVFNDTRVIPARLYAVKESGGKVEVLLERPLEGNLALVHARASKPLRPDMPLQSRGGTLRVIEKRGDLWVIELPETALAFFERYGQMPLPPYIHREPDAADSRRYQSVFARKQGAVAAPTASLHFDDALLAALDARGVQRTFITLHVGAGTFQPVRADAVGAHVMHAEFVEVNAEACAQVAAARARRSRGGGGNHGGPRARERRGRRGSRALRGRLLAVHRAGFPLPRDRRHAHQLSSARVHAAHAGQCLRGARGRAGGVRACRGESIPFLQLW
jgi:S-adenosylmethionine:tRNA ribosyltransferase-isomerase